MSRRRHLASLYASGELAALVRQHKTTRAVAAALGMERKALCSLLDRMRDAGEMGTWEELARPALPLETLDRMEQQLGELSARSQFANSESGQVRPEPAAPAPDRNRWPSVAAFDAVTPVVPPGHTIKGVSTLVDPDGNVKQQWVKTSAQDDERQMWLEAMRSLADELPRVDPVPPPDIDPVDMLTVLPAGDPHAGLLSWHEDAGENFDLDIAERNLVRAFRHLIALSPRGSEALLVFIGDNVHADGQFNTTTKGTRVDVDGRTVKMMRTIIRICRRAIDLSLAHHSRTSVIVERGNHDELLSAMLALSLSLLYENEPRVHIDVSPEMFHWFRFGSVLIGTHHGDKVKPMDLLGVMAVDRQADWSETKHRRFYCGHYHHLMTKEVPGVVVEYLPTLAASDAWHRAHGYRSQRAMYMDIFHRERGHENRHIVGIEQLR